MKAAAPAPGYTCQFFNEKYAAHTVCFLFIIGLGLSVATTTYRDDYYTPFTRHNFSVPARYATARHGTVRLKYDV